MCFPICMLVLVHVVWVQRLSLFHWKWYFLHCWYLQCWYWNLPSIIRLSRLVIFSVRRSVILSMKIAFVVWLSMLGGGWYIPKIWIGLVLWMSLQTMHSIVIVVFFFHWFMLFYLSLYISAMHCLSFDGLSHDLLTFVSLSHVSFITAISALLSWRYWTIRLSLFLTDLAFSFAILMFFTTS